MSLNRRSFLSLAAGTIFVPQFERWFRPLQGLYLPQPAPLIRPQDNLTTWQFGASSLKWGGEGVFWDVTDEPGYLPQPITSYTVNWPFGKDFSTST